MGFLMGEPGPEAQSTLLAETAGDYFLAEASRRLEQGDAVDAGVVAVAVIPCKIFCEAGDGMTVVQELTWVFR
jgi:hypothetical protein